MTKTIGVAALSIAGAVLAALACIWTDYIGAPLARVAIMPDISSLSHASDEGFIETWLRLLAGGMFGMALALSAHARRSWVRDGLLLVNPIAFLAFAEGASAGLFLSAATLVATAAATLVVTRDYRACILLAAALTAAPFVSNTLLFFYPPLMIALPVLSPWGPNPRKAIGFSIVIWSPLAMTMGGLAYLDWLLGGILSAAPIDAPDWNEAQNRDLLFIAAGAATIAAANVHGSRIAAALACLVGAGLFMITHPEWLNLA